MSESVRDTASTESLCTVIENSTDYNEHKRSSTSHGENDDTDEATDLHSDHSESQANEISATNDDLNTSNIADCVSNNINNNNNNHNNHKNNNNSNFNSNKPEKPATKPRSKWKKSVSFDPNDEKIQKFITGDPIVDQQNPFRHSFSSATSANGNLAPKPKKIPPPVPTKRSTLSIRKTVTQQLREREREKEKEKEKERERIKNEANSRKSISNSGAGAGPLLPSPDDFVTTEEVLKQSKYVKTYIKNPDPYFVYDPTVLARIKFDELREIADKKPPKKLKLSTQTRERLKDLKNKPPGETVAAFKPKELAFKKCSKPNYPELADIKVKVGTTPDDDYFNLAEVTKNAKKFDERVKKLHIGSDDDLDELDEPLTKSESSDEITVNANSHSEAPPPQPQPQPQHNDESDQMRRVINGKGVGEQRVDGTFTNTINSEEFQQYLEQKGLTLLPKKIPNGAQCVYSGSNGVAGPLNYNQISFKSPETVKISADAMDASHNAKKPSVFQRLLANSIFASRRRTMPKETVPMPRSLYEMNATLKEKGGSVRSPTQIKRVVLERQSFHGRSRAGNLLSATEVKDLKNQTERTRKSFASGDDLSLSISSALTNAEYANEPELRQSNIPTAPGVRRTDLQSKPIAKPPRRTLSRDRLSSTQNSLRHADHEALPKPKGQRGQAPAAQYSLSRDSSQRNGDASSGPGDRAQFRRTLERQSLIPKRTTEAQNDKRQVFGRSASMDRNEILKRTVSRGLQNRSKSAAGTLKVLANSANSNENLRQQFGPQMTSTPIRDTAAPVHSMEQRTFIPIASGAATKPPDAVYVDQLEWDRLRAMKERTDRELYYKVLQQQQQQQLLQKKQQRLDDENIYEHLPPNQVLVPHKALVQRHAQVLAEGNFIRASPQRNTFSGVLRNRQAKIIDGRAMLADEQPQLLRPQAIDYSNPSMVAGQNASERSQSVLDGMTLASKGGLRRGYDSDNDTPVVLRRKNAPEESTPQRRIGGILTRDEILQKVKEFCRKSLNKTPTISQAPQMQAIYERQPAAGTDLSPVSYASVETHQRPVSRMYAAPQVPQRMHSLPQQFIPIGHESLTTASSGNAATASPIYAHVVKRNSMQSNQSELYESPPRAYYHVARARLDSGADAQQSAAVYVTREGALLQRPESAFATTQYVIVDGDKLAPAEIIHYYQGDLYAQPQYVRPHQLQRALLPGQYGYITVREALPQQQLQLQPQQSQQQQMRQRLHDGRSTPLVLDGSSQLASQIYWTPQHQRLQQHAGLLPVQISPRYMFKQPYPVPATAPIAALRMDTTNRATNLNATHGANIPNGATMRHALIPTNQLKKQMMPPLPPAPDATTAATSADYSSYSGVQPPCEWESGSEAGEVQRIMERANSDTKYAAQQHNG